MSKDEPELNPRDLVIGNTEASSPSSIPTAGPTPNPQDEAVSHVARTTGETSQPPPREPGALIPPGDEVMSDAIRNVETSEPGATRVQGTVQGATPVQENSVLHRDPSALSSTLPIEASDPGNQAQSVKVEEPAQSAPQPVVGDVQSTSDTSGQVDESRVGVHDQVGGKTADVTSSGTSGGQFRGSHRINTRSPRRKVRPVTDADIEDFQMDVESGRPLDMMAEEYQVKERTIRRWCKELKARIPKTGRGAHVAYGRRISESAISATAAVTRAVQTIADEVGQPGAIQTGPQYDEKARKILQEIETLAENTHSVQELTKVQQKLMTLLTMSLNRAPGRSWEELGNAAGALYRMILYSRRVDADMPEAANPAIQRQEAARQLMAEMGSVMSLDEQKVFGEMIQVAADRLAKKNGYRPIIEAKVEDSGSPLEQDAPLVPQGAPQPDRPISPSMAQRPGDGPVDPALPPSEPWGQGHVATPPAGASPW